MTVTLGLYGGGNPRGWTKVVASADTRTVYVSAQGHDGHNGLSTHAPKRTIAAAKQLLRGGYPDWLLLKAGETFDDSFGQWGLSGRSAQEPMLLSSYGTGARPILRTGQQSGIASGWWPAPVSNLAIIGIDFWAHQYAGSQGCAAIVLQNGGSNILIEDCVARGFQNGIVPMGASGNRMKNFGLRRSVVVDSWCLQGTAGNGLYASDCDGLVIEENVFDANGWTSAHPHNGIAPGHSAYIQDGCTGVAARGNIAATTDGFQLRSGGIMEDNLFLGCAIPMVFGWGMSIAPNGVQAIVRRNVALDSKDSDQSHPGGWGMLCANLRDSEISGNILAHLVSGSQRHAMVIQTDGIGIRNVRVEGNVIYNWGGAIQIRGPGSQYQNLQLIGNKIQDLQGRDALIQHDDQTSASAQRIVSRDNQFHHGGQPANWFSVWGGKTLSQWKAMVGDTTSDAQVAAFPDPTRNIGSYHATLGGAPGLAAFMAQARLQSKAKWRKQYTASAVNMHVRAGFGMQ